MTDEELKQTVADVLKSVQELRESQREALAEQRAALAEQRVAQQAALTEQGVAQQAAQAERQAAQQVAEKEWREAMRVSEERRDRVIEQTNQQLGRLGNKLGRYTEGLAEQSLYRILLQDFQLEEAAPRVKARNNGRNMEIDFLGFTRDERKTAIAVEIKSRFGEDDFQQVMQMLQEFPKFFTEHADKKVYGLVVAVDIPENMRNRLLKAGLYLALLSNEVLQLVNPPNFVPKQYNPHFVANGTN